MVTDEDGAQSIPAIATIMFNMSDNKPLLDLNGPLQSGFNYTINYNEDTQMPIPVRVALSI